MWRCICHQPHLGIVQELRTSVTSSPYLVFTNLYEALARYGINASCQPNLREAAILKAI